MNPEEAVSAFLKYHFVDPSGLMEEEREAIAHAVACHGAINVGYANLPTSVLEQDMAVGLLWQLFERCTERIQAAIVAMATSCAAASEIVSRASMEACATLRYILLDRNRHLASFLKYHIEEAKRQQRQWRAVAETLAPRDRAVQLTSCDYRAKATAALDVLVTEISSRLLEGEVVPAWPNIAQRFGAIGEAINYRTFYARLCAEPHLDAEETLRHFLGMISGSEALTALGIETVAFSRMVLFEATCCYARAGRSYAGAHGMREAVDVCSAAERAMTRHVFNFSNEIGAVPKAG